MKKILSTLILFIFATLCAKAYQNFDGKYNYNTYNSGAKVSTNFSDDDTEVLFIMDFSGSMNKHMGYAPKSFLAIDAIRSILNETGTRTKIGLRVFGITDRSLYEYSERGVEYNKLNICTASSLVMPIARYNNENISDILSNYKAQGATPIGYSLRQAIQNDFSPNTSLKHIILVTDGYENCGDDPCAYISKIMKLRNDIKIDVIGITVDENQYSKLNCISNAANGSYYRVDSPDDFDIKFKQAFHSTTPKTTVSEPVITKSFQNRNSFDIKYKNFAYEFKN